MRVLRKRMHSCAALLVTAYVVSMNYGIGFIAAGRHQRARFIMTSVAHCTTIVTSQQELLLALWTM